MLRMDPALPMLRMDPALPTLRMEPELPMDRIEPALPMLKMLPMLRILPILPKLRMLSKLFALNTPASAPRVARPRFEREHPRMVVSSPSSASSGQSISLPDDALAGRARCRLERRNGH
jgi:hypothetical protein